MNLVGTGTQTTSTASHVTHAVPRGGVDNRLLLSVFSKPTDPSYVLHFHI